MVGVAYTEESDTFIRIYNIHSGERIHTHQCVGSLAGMWANSGSLQFAIIVPAEKMSVCGIAFAPGHCYENVTDTLAAPPGINLTTPLLFSPSPYRVSYILGHTLKVWDPQGRRYLLSNEDASFNGSAMAFSPDGGFFACGTVGSDIYLWKGHTSGYAFYRKLPSSFTSPAPLFSPDNKSVIAWGRSMLQLFSLEDSATPAPDDTFQTSGQKRPFILEFSPDNSSVAFARLGDKVVTVIDLKSCARRIVIDAGTEVYGLKFSDDAIAVGCRQELIVWDLSKGGGASDGKATIKDSVRTTGLRSLVTRRPEFTSISPDLLMLAETWSGRKTGNVGSIVVYDVETGVQIWGTKVDCDKPWFSPDGGQIWCDVGAGEERGWSVVKTSGLDEIELVPLTGSPPETWPWRSSCGYTVTDDGWIHNCKGKPLMLLPPSWISNERNVRVWNGRFLALLHSTLSQPVILELDPE